MCGLTNNYADSVVRFKLIAGLNDSEIKEDILSMEDKTLEETVKLVESKESGKIAKKTVGVAGAEQVTQVKVEGSPQNNTPSRKKPCTHCGRKTHGSSPQEREKSCPAYSQTCNKCSRTGHYQAVCRTAKSSSSSEVAIDESKTNLISEGSWAGLLFAMASITKQVERAGKTKVPHMLYEQLQWVKKAPPRHPTCSLSVSVSVKGYHDNNYKPPPATRRCNTDMLFLADTGCQACCMGPTQLHSLGMTEVDLLEPTLNLKAANTTGITILGAVYLHISGRDRTGQKWETHQLCYVAQDIEQLLLSRDACEQLGMISKSFPEVGSCSDVSIGQVAQNEMREEWIGQEDHILPEVEEDLTPCTPNKDGGCDCPRRESPPPPPQCPPDQSPEQLRKLIIKHYASSAFNRCTRQTLPMMKGDPLPIITKVGARPIAVHSPIPTPFIGRNVSSRT